eukprot:495636-Pyramimonas_sp.AAC.1
MSATSPEPVFVDSPRAGRRPREVEDVQALAVAIVVASTGSEGFSYAATSGTPGGGTLGAGGVQVSSSRGVTRRGGQT